MVFGKLRGRSSKSAEPPPEAPAGPSGLAALLTEGITLQPDRVALLKDAYAEGLEFFESFNDSRLKLAFGSFDEAMRKALFEVLYLLHVNDPSMAEFKFTAIKRERVRGVVKETPVEAVTDLYVEGAPHGVQGIDQLSPVFREQFDAYVRDVFGGAPPGQSTYGYCPITSIHSLGSIGTIGHKSVASDLDLQVQYDLEPFLIDTSGYSDATFKQALHREMEYTAHRVRAQQKLPASALQDPKMKEALLAKARQEVAKSYPLLCRYFFAGGPESLNTNEPGTHGKVVHELITLMKRNLRIGKSEELKRKEELFRERIKRIQQYLFDKFPQAEVYLFTASNDDYRRGYHGTTLENKEASGSAYELILNYETLMPGIQMTPMVPSHFLLPQVINDDAARYDRIIDYIRFRSVDIYDPVRSRIVNLGRVPDMELSYVARHGGAVYWEAFKASSGNLPKATLNLLRFEELLDKRFGKTIIQMIKHPDEINELASPPPEKPQQDIDAMVANEIGVPPWALIEMEGDFPQLLRDPWWLRYKALKIGFTEDNGIEGISTEDRNRISKVIDLAFALHVRISDVFSKPGDTRSFDSHREKALIEFLRRAFPPVSAKRQFLEHLFIGGIHAVNEFERELRDLFKATLARANQKIAAFKIEGGGNQKEFEIWFHYYRQNFEPAPNVIQRTIMNHLKVPRGRVRVGYEAGKGWFFNSIQRESGVGKRFDTFGMLDHLPDEVTLIQNVPFLNGLTHCIINGYYGIVNKGTLKEHLTTLEFDPKAMDLGNRVDNALSFVRPDQVTRILYTILDHFPYQEYHYMDCIRLKRSVTEVLVLVNLLKFGRVSVLYRDNLRTWYCDEFDHPDIFKLAQRYNQNPADLVKARSLHITLAKFFKARGVPLDKVRFTAWLNPNSVETSHSSGQAAQKEKMVSGLLEQMIRRVHFPKPPSEEEEAATAASGEAAGEAAATPAEGTPPADAAGEEGETPPEAAAR